MAKSEGALFPNVCDSCGCSNPSTKRELPTRCFACGTRFVKVRYKAKAYNQHPGAKEAQDDE